MAVAELVPPVAGGERRLVGHDEGVPAGDRLEHRQMGGLRFVPAGEQPVDGADTASGVMMRSVQPSPGCTVPPESVTVSRARTTVVPTAMTCPPP